MSYTIDEQLKFLQIGLETGNKNLSEALTSTKAGIIGDFGTEKQRNFVYKQENN